MLVAEFVIIASTLLGIDYTVRNATPHDIYIFDRVFMRTQRGEPVVDPALAYRRLRGDGKLVVEKVLQPIPDGLKVEFPEIPYLTRIEPGESRSGRITLDIPVQEFHAYLEQQGSGGRPVSGVLLRIGYLSAADIASDMGVLRPDPHGGKGVFSASYGLANRLQRIFEIDLGRPPINVLVGGRE